MEIVIFVVALGIFGLASLAFGYDSRDGFEEAPR